MNQHAHSYEISGLKAIHNLKALCEKYLPGAYTLEIIDLTQQPELAIRDQIVALPTLVRQLPEPIKKIIGTLSNEENFLIELDIEKKVAATHESTE